MINLELTQLKSEMSYLHGKVYEYKGEGITAKSQDLEELLYLNMRLLDIISSVNHKLQLVYGRQKEHFRGDSHAI